MGFRLAQRMKVDELVSWRGSRVDSRRVKEGEREKRRQERGKGFGE